MNQQADADVCAKHINHCEHKIPASNLHTLHPAYFLITKYITQWENMNSTYV